MDALQLMAGKLQIHHGVVKQMFLWQNSWIVGRNWELFEDGKRGVDYDTWPARNWLFVPLRG
jgi:hypothetical protein